MNSSLRELHVWQPWPSLLFRPSPLPFFHILALVAPRLLLWHQVRHFFESTGAWITDVLLHFQNWVFFSITSYEKSVIGKSLGISWQVVQANPSLYVKLQACLFLLDRPLFTPRKLPPTLHRLLAGVATRRTPPTTWCPPLHQSRAPKSSRRRLWGGPRTFIRTTRRPRCQGWYVLHAAQRQDDSSSCSLEHLFSFLSTRKLLFSNSVPGVSYLPYLSLHCTPRGLHAAQS